MRVLLKSFLCVTVGMLSGGWGFFGHRKINELAVYTLPPPMLGFYKKNLRYLIDTSVNPDRRRYAVRGEAARHYIDLDAYGADPCAYWSDA